ncbi:unnamed protein product, partial [Discosporangium mesarthrocarpum]
MGVGQVENLRSQVSKNAILTLQDMWRGMGRALDPELPMACPVLVRRSGDKVEFLAEAAGEAVDQVVASASEGRALSAFLPCAQHHNPVLRAKA